MMFNVRSDQGAIVFAIEGEISIYNIAKFKEAIDLLREKGVGRIVFDLGKVDYVDSTAIKFFLTLTKDLGDRGGRVCLASANPDVLETFRITRVDRFLNLFGTVEQAIGHGAAPQ